MKQENIQQLTRAEEQIMQVLWKIRKGFVKDILTHLPAPKPAYNTVSTIVRILETKGFVGHTAYGKSYEYFPVISRDAYRKAYLNQFVSNYFGGSFSRLVSFFAKENDMDLQQLEEMLRLAEDREPSGEETNTPKQD